MQKILESLADKIIITKDFPFYMRLISWFCFSLSYFKQELFSVLQVCEIDFSFVTKLVRTNENYIYLFLTIFTFFNMYIFIVCILDFFFKIKDSLPDIAFQIYIIYFYISLWVDCFENFHILHKGFSVINFWEIHFSKPLYLLLLFFLILPIVFYMFAITLKGIENLKKTLSQFDKN